MDTTERVARAITKAQGYNPDNNASRGQKMWQLSIGEAQAAIDAMPQPALEFCITDGPGMLIDFGTTTDEMRVSVFELANELKVWVSPTTTDCMTGR